LAQGAANRGLGQSGQVALGVPQLGESMMRQSAAQEAQLAALRQQMENSRVHQYQQGWGMPLLSGLLGAGGTIGGAMIGAPGLGAAAGGAAGAGLSSLAGGGGGAHGAAQGGVQAGSQAVLEALRRYEMSQLTPQLMPRGGGH